MLSKRIERENDPVLNLTRQRSNSLMSEADVNYMLNMIESEVH